METTNLRAESIPLESDLEQLLLSRQRELERFDGFTWPKSEEALLAYKLLIEEARDIALFVRCDGQILEANKAAVAAYGYDRDMLLRMRIHDLRAFDRQESIASQIAQAQSGGIQFETLHRRKNGSVFPVEVSSRGTTIAGQPVLLSLVRDISERKGAEIALRESEGRFRLLAENARDVIFRYELKPNRGYSYVSPSIERLSGYTPEDHYADPDFPLKIVHPDDYPIMRNLTSDPTSPQRPTVLRWICLNGDTLWVEQQVTVWRDDMGHPVAVEGIARDITERKRMEDRLLHAQRLEMAGTIAAQVAHDFANLLGPLLGYAELVRMSLPKGHQATQYCDAMLEITPQIADINENLISLSKRGRGVHEAIDLNALVLEMTRQILPRPLQLNVDLDLATDLLPANGTSAQLLRVVANLVANAREAVGDVGNIAIRTQNVYVDKPIGNYSQVEVGEYVRLDIADDGCGIPHEIRGRIFDPFFTTKRQERRRGSGLGLSVVHAIVGDYRGYIDLESELGKGTTFSVFLPVCRDTPKVSPDTEVRGGTESLLVIDDDPVQREQFQLYFRLLGYAVETLKNGEEAVDYLRGHEVDLLLLDMVMPGGMDGAETYRRVLARNPGQRAIIVSGYSESERVREALAMGASTFVRKPVSLERLARVVRDRLDQDIVGTKM